MCKPATSKAGNSEVYVVCLGFDGGQSLERYMPTLLSHFGESERKTVRGQTFDIGNKALLLNKKGYFKQISNLRNITEF